MPVGASWMGKRTATATEAFGGAHSRRWRYKRTGGGDRDSNARRSAAHTVAGGGTTVPMAATVVPTSTVQTIFDLCAPKKI